MGGETRYGSELLYFRYRSNLTHSKQENYMPELRTIVNLLFLARPQKPVVEKGATLLAGGSGASWHLRNTDVTNECPGPRQ